MVHRFLPVLIKMPNIKNKKLGFLQIRQNKNEENKKRESTQKGLFIAIFFPEKYSFFVKLQRKESIKCHKLYHIKNNQIKLAKMLQP